MIHRIAWFILNHFPAHFASQLSHPRGILGFLIGRMMNQGNATLIRLAYDNLNLKKDDNLLEVGYGNGKTIAWLFPPLVTGSYHGVDLSADMLKAATKNIKSMPSQQQKQIHLYQGNLSKLEFNANSFDAAVSVNTIYFWPTPKNEIRELRRVIRPGGRLVIGLRQREDIEKLPLMQHGFTLYSLTEVADLMRDAGFQNIEFQSQSDQQIDAWVVIGH